MYPAPVVKLVNSSRKFENCQALGQSQLEKQKSTAPVRAQVSMHHISSASRSKPKEHNIHGERKTSRHAKFSDSNTSTWMCHQPSHAFSPLSKQRLRLGSSASHSELVMVPGRAIPNIRRLFEAAELTLPPCCDVEGKPDKTDFSEMVWFQRFMRHTKRHEMLN